jgi:1-acyl-sn-glycerol-3-phosphate acyltransferase
MLPVLEMLSRRYFRVDARGLEHIPRTPALFVGNHSSGVSGCDILCTLPVLWRALGPDAPLYGLAHDAAMRHLRPFGALIQRYGAIRASRDNAVRVLGSGGSVLVYPGGDLDAFRHWSRRNEIVILPRTGFVDVARAAGVPIVPIVVEGAHANAYIFSEGKRIARWLRLPRWGRVERFPLALALPWGLAAGPFIPYLPLPLRVRLRVLPPLHVGDTPTLEMATRVQAAMQACLTSLATSSSAP